MSNNKLLPVPNFIDGEWIVPETAETAPVYNPSTGQKIAETPLCGADLVDESVLMLMKPLPIGRKRHQSNEYASFFVISCC